MNITDQGQTIRQMPHGDRCDYCDRAAVKQLTAKNCPHCADWFIADCCEPCFEELYSAMERETNARDAEKTQWENRPPWLAIAAIIALVSALYAALDYWINH